jgi:hypothetical protein
MPKQYLSCCKGFAVTMGHQNAHNGMGKSNPLKFHKEI